ncbi:hypothetical protein SAMN05421790_105192 [Kroppenstedtia eburnea]|uniref:Acetyltransferase (GNAT) domain-containing protein n=1 Tax=Kroppenstedtia eburnea TaxID=714067 RepID=A0A1N7M478_9BACL|nr:hypothetical protein SAMN05421790_105192 [Kroppenstedtia eburnea]
MHTGKKVRLRAIREEDLDTIVRIWMDNSLLASDKIPYPLELEEVREYLKKIRSDGNGYIFAVETLADHSMIRNHQCLRHQLAPSVCLCGYLPRFRITQPGLRHRCHGNPAPIHL